MKGVLIVFFLLIFLGSCAPDTAPAGIIPERRMIALLTDIHVADGYANAVGTDSLKKYGPRLYRSIFRKYQTDSAGLKKSIAWYSKDPVQFKAMYDVVKANLQKLQKAEERRVHQINPKT